MTNDQSFKAAVGATLVLVKPTNQVSAAQPDGPDDAGYSQKITQRELQGTGCLDWMIRELSGRRPAGCALAACTARAGFPWDGVLPR